MKGFAFAVVTLVVLVVYDRSRHRRRLQRHLRRALKPLVTMPSAAPLWARWAFSSGPWLRLYRDGTVIVHAHPALVAHPVARTRLAEAIGAQLATPIVPTWTVGSGTVTFTPLRIPNSCGPAHSPDVGVLDIGETGFGVPLQLQLADPRHTHLLIAGSTGSGKSVLLRGLLRQIAGWGQVILIDLKRDFTDITHPNVARHTTVDAAAEAIHAARMEMDDRYQARERGEDVGQPLVVAVDEASELRAQALESYGRNPGVFADLSAILRLG